MSYLTHLECTACGQTSSSDELQTVCRSCGKVLYARYDLARARRELDRGAFAGRPPTLWRWHELLPVRDPAHVLTLGEGGTPLLPAPRLGAELACDRLFIKEEGLNPTGTFKARGMAVAVSRARELGVPGLVAPTAGNAGGAMAAYAARAGLPAHVFMPQDAPVANKLEAQVCGAEVHLVAGLITDAGRLAREKAKAQGWFDVSTLREPYRVEGKKTMGYELALQFGWELPDAILYPTGGGTGLVGMWKAFDELEALGWIGARRPRMFAVQATGCAPIVRAFARGDRFAETWENAQTMAGGLRVPAAIGDYLMLDILRQSGGGGVAVSDQEMLAAMSEVARIEGVVVCPEGAATVAGLRRLLQDGHLRGNERIVVFNTGSGLKYLDQLRQAAGASPARA
ncbi:MAG: threonine synthase [Chloroflexi bacterium]|nr:threonine synthase [Chloroflexota bacterium]